MKLERILKTALIACYLGTSLGMIGCTQESPLYKQYKKEKTRQESKKEKSKKDTDKDALALIENIIESGRKSHYEQFKSLYSELIDQEHRINKWRAFYNFADIKIDKFLSCNIKTSDYDFFNGRRIEPTKFAEVEAKQHTIYSFRAYNLEVTEYAICKYTLILEKNQWKMYYAEDKNILDRQERKLDNK